MDYPKLNNAKELRIFRKTKLAEIYALDLANTCPYEELLRKWSNAADYIIQSALKITLENLQPSHSFCVVALGKLGSLELNYSSDIDLIYISDGDIEPAAKIAARLGNLLEEITEDGFVFRVDTNLRPLGKDGPLVNSVAGLERYYERSGHEWERQALIRARPVAGDISLGDEFIKRIKPFVFRKSFDLSALKKIKTTKLALEKTASAEGWRNIKLGAGGIREVEFLVQAFQLLHGGRLKDLQTTNTFEALHKLLLHGIISQNKYDQLKNAYVLLRRTENIMQAKDDRQIHILPSDADELLELANKLGFHSVKKFVISLDDARRNIQTHFESLFEANYEKMEIAEAMEANLESCADKEEIIDSLAWFKNHISKRIQELDLNNKLDMDEISERLTILAEIIIGESLKIARQQVAADYGAARTAKNRSAEISVIGMGRFGTYELDYGSDLDLVFVYSKDGESDGPKKITNREYFTKIAQKVISIITLPTRYGRAYAIDAELRPSGNQGALVTSLEAFERYHRREASLWEKEALFRARVVAGDVTLGKKLASLLEDINLTPQQKHNVKEQIHELRSRAIKEISGKQIDLKKGIGGIADIEAISRSLQIINGGNTTLLKRKKIPEILDALNKERIIAGDEYSILSEAYNTYRKLLSRTRLFVPHTGAALDTNADYFQSVYTTLGFKTKIEILDKIEKLQKGVRNIYTKYMASYSA
jgi:glutamine synthetase adenylyltransferase